MTTIYLMRHSTSTAFLLSQWYQIQYIGSYKFNNKDFFDGKWNYCETFRLDFDDNNNLLNIKI